MPNGAMGKGFGKFPDSDTRWRELTVWNLTTMESWWSHLHVARPVMGLVSGPGYTSNY